MKNILTIFLLLICGICFGQNLVPNPSFEDTLHCPIYFSYNFPTQYNGVINAPPWDMTTWGTSDYFNQCNDSVVGVPANSMGFQYARTGVAYMGIATLHSGNYREYISAPLLDTLLAGTTYYGSMYISLACNPSNICWTGADKIGLYFSHGLPDTTGVLNQVILVTPQIENPSGNIITDTLNWVKVSGAFTAMGGENYITIGNFRDAGNTSGSYAYY